MDLVMQSQIPWYEFHFFFSVKLEDLMNLYRLQYRKARYAKPVSEYRPLAHDVIAPVTMHLEDKLAIYA